MIAAGEKLLGVLAGWRGYAAATIAGAALAWTVQGWRYGAELANQRADRAEEVADGQRQAREILARRRAEVDGIDERNARAEWAAYGGMRNAQIQDDGLRADIDAGRQRLHVRAACPAAGGGMPRPAPPPAWVMEPAPSLIPLLDRIISPSGRESSR